MQQVIECVSVLSPIVPAAGANNVQSTGKLQYSVYETWHKNCRTTPKQLFVDWFVYKLAEGYEEDVSKYGANLSCTTKSAFKRHKWVAECMLRCCNNHPDDPIPDTPEQRAQWEASLGIMADTALQQLKETLNLDEGHTITQHTITGNVETRKKIMEERPLPQNTPLHSTFRPQTKRKKRQRNDADSANVELYVHYTRLDWPIVVVYK
jgi:hypothetical protein